MEILQNQDINDLVVKNPISTYYLRVSGDSMASAGIFQGDIVATCKATPYKHRSIVVAAINGEFTMKRLIQTGRNWELWPENNQYPVIKLDPADEMTIWGTVIGVIRKF